MEFTTLQIGIERNVARVALNRPEVHNALTPTMIKELTETFEWLSCRDDIRVIEVCGNGKSFCAGADINYMREMADFDHAQNLEDARLLANLFKTIYFCNKPVISVVHGAVVGGGNGITAVSDIVLCDRETVFAFSEVRLGITPATISPFVISRCGEAVARDLMLSGRRFSADEALNFRLVNFVGSKSEVDEQLDKYIGYYLSASPSAIAECKHLIRKVAGRADMHDPIFDFTASMIAAQRGSEAGREGLSAFMEKRKPNWVE